jgi:hypothetical protein
MPNTVPHSAHWWKGRSVIGNLGRIFRNCTLLRTLPTLCRRVPLTVVTGPVGGKRVSLGLSAAEWVILQCDRQWRRCRCRPWRARWTATEPYRTPQRNRTGCTRSLDANPLRLRSSDELHGSNPFLEIPFLRMTNGPRGVLPVKTWPPSRLRCCERRHRDLRGGTGWVCCCGKGGGFLGQSCFLHGRDFCNP